MKSKVYHFLNLQCTLESEVCGCICLFMQLIYYCSLPTFFYSNGLRGFLVYGV
jgi:hypothetical protein